MRKVQWLARKISRRWADVGWSDFGPKVFIRVHSFQELTLARAMLRKAFGRWTDEMQQVWGASEKYTNVSWASKERNDVEIWWVSMPIDDMPKRPGCGFKEVERVDLVYACGLEDGT